MARNKVHRREALAEQNPQGCCEGRGLRVQKEYLCTICATHVQSLLVHSAQKRGQVAYKQAFSPHFGEDIQMNSNGDSRGRNILSIEKSHLVLALTRVTNSYQWFFLTILLCSSSISRFSLNRFTKPFIIIISS